MTSARTLKAIRLTHLYFGVFFAPAILFFAITGGLQMFGLHETSRGSAYVPPSILVHLAQLHKKGTLYLPPRRPAPPPSPAKAEPPKPEAAKPVLASSSPATVPAPQHNALATKIFFAATAIALVISTLTGIVMAWQYARRKSVIAVMLAAGIVVPLLLLLI